METERCRNLGSSRWPSLELPAQLEIVHLSLVQRRLMEGDKSICISTPTGYVRIRTRKGAGSGWVTCSGGGCHGINRRRLCTRSLRHHMDQSRPSTLLQQDGPCRFASISFRLVYAILYSPSGLNNGAEDGPEPRHISRTLNGHFSWSCQGNLQRE